MRPRTSHDPAAARIPQAGARAPADSATPAARPAMVPIRALLSRIQWDREFGAARFEIGWYDRVAARIVRSPLPKRHAAPAPESAPAPPGPRETGNRARIALTDESGVPARIPLHRVREVFRNGELIWQRPTPDRTTGGPANAGRCFTS